MDLFNAFSSVHHNIVKRSSSSDHNHVGATTTNSPPSADVVRDDKVHAYHRIDSLNILVYLVLLSLTIVTIWVFKHRRVRYLHETGLAIIYGIIVGCFIRYLSPTSEVSHVAVMPINATIANSSWYESGPPDSLWLRVPVPDRSPGSRVGQYTNKTFDYTFQGEVVNVGHFGGGGKELQERASFDPEIFFNIVLPPIIFHAGFSMKHKFFFRNIGAILTFAVLGTALAALVVGAITYAFTRLMTTLAMTFVDCLFFGAVISSTDPVTVLAIFHDVNVDGLLYALVFGEAILNDAVSIVMSSTVTRFSETSTSESGVMLSILTAIGYFFYVFFGSLALGCFIGCATALLTKFTHLRDYPMLEATLFIVMSYASYNLAEALDFTGIVAVLFCGICQAHYTYNNLSHESKMMTKQFFELLNFVAENFIFCYIGVSLFTFQKHHWDIGFILCSFLALIISRVVSVYPLSAMLNLGRKHPIPLNYQHMLFFSGLRGAVAFALAIRNTVSTARRAIATTTCVLVMFTVIVCGGSAPQLLQWLHIPTGVDENNRVPRHHHHNEAVVLATATNDSNKKQRSSQRRKSYETLESVSGGNNNNNSHAIIFPDTNGILEADNNVTAANAADISGEMSTTLEQHVNAARLRERSWGARVWRNFDDLLLKPILTHYRPSLMETCPRLLLPLARLLSSRQQIEQAERLLSSSNSGRIDEEDADGDVVDSVVDRGPFVPAAATSASGRVSSGGSSSGSASVINNRHNRQSPAAAATAATPVGGGGVKSVSEF